MTNAATIESDVSTILSTTWDSRDGIVIPKTEDVALKNGAVKLDAVVLYADLFHSTTLARRFPRSAAAKIVRAYLSSMTKMVKRNGGQIRSFDGDRVMGIFVGDNKNSAAAKCALNMKYVVTQILRPKAEQKFPSLKEKGFVIDHCAGIAHSSVFVVRGGVRGSNDLVFIGEAPNIAAKLSDIRNSPRSSYITKAVYARLSKESKYSGGKDMWSPASRVFDGVTYQLFASSYYWKP